MIQYRITPTGKKALSTGNHFVQLINDIARDGVITTKELTFYGLNKEESEYLLSMLSRLNFIEPAPIQGVQHVSRERRN